jgi:hypothetical protein
VSEHLRTEFANAQRKGEFQKAGELACSTIPKLNANWRPSRKTSII